MAIDEAFNGFAQEAFTECENGSEELWVILIDGKRVFTRSHKCLWNKRGFALNALHYHLNATAVQKLHSRRIAKYTGMTFTSDEIREAKERWMETHAEIITLREWEERNN